LVVPASINAFTKALLSHASRVTSAISAVRPCLLQQLDSVLRVICLVFDERYSAYSGESLMLHDLSIAAIRLELRRSEWKKSSRSVVEFGYCRSTIG